MMTKHARTRAQQRGVPGLIERWLEQYGEEVYDGHGGAIYYFSQRSRRSIERHEGREPVRRMWEFLDCYKVVSSHDGSTITVGRLHKRIRRH